MPLKIIHHKEQTVDQEQKKISLNIEESLTKMFFFCENIINTANLIFKKTNFSKIIENMDFEKKNKDLCDLENVYAENSDKFIKLMDLFSTIFGKKTSLLEAISKATSIMQKISILANNFGISLKPEEKSNCDILTDEDIDIMVQMVKDFGEEQIRKDAQECREKLSEKFDLKNKAQPNEVDIYDVYHDESTLKHDQKNIIKEI